MFRKFRISFAHKFRFNPFSKKMRTFLKIRNAKISQKTNAKMLGGDGNANILRKKYGGEMINYDKIKLLIKLLSKQIIPQVFLRN